MVDEGEPDRSTVGLHSKTLDATFDELITDLDAENVKRLNAYQDHLVQLG